MIYNVISVIILGILEIVSLCKSMLYCAKHRESFSWIVHGFTSCTGASPPAFLHITLHCISHWFIRVIQSKTQTERLRMRLGIQPNTCTFSALSELCTCTNNNHKHGADNISGHVNTLATILNSVPALITTINTVLTTFRGTLIRWQQFWTLYPVSYTHLTLPTRIRV